MRKLIIVFFVLVIGVNKSISQSPSYSLGTNSKYYDFKKTFISNDFKNASQVRVGSYLTLGNFGYSNSSWIGSNAILDYSSYGNVGTLGNNNFFIPHWNKGTALVMHLNFVNGAFTGYNHTWNDSSTMVNFSNFEKIWELGKVNSYFLSNVGIGTTTLDAKLTVKGNIHTQEVKVDLNGAVAPDYVFKEDYNLKSLEQVQAYINKNGHLPNIPSAAEMEKEGVLLKEMNLKLLEKIEELTLYVIELKKENREGKLMNRALEIRLEKLESK